MIRSPARFELLEGGGADLRVGVAELADQGVVFQAVAAAAFGGRRRRRSRSSAGAAALRGCATSGRRARRGRWGCRRPPPGRRRSGGVRAAARSGRRRSSGRGGRRRCAGRGRARRTVSTCARGYQAEPMAPRIGCRRPSFSSWRTLNSLAKPSASATCRRDRWSSNPDGGLMSRRTPACAFTEGNKTPMTRHRASYSSGLTADIHRGFIGGGRPRRSHLASPPDRGKKPGLHGAFERPLGSGPDPLDHRHPPRPEPVHPRQHRVRREGAAQHAAGPVPGDWPRLRHGAPRERDRQRGALLAKRGHVTRVRPAAGEVRRAGGAGRGPPPEGGGRRRRHHRAEPGAQRGRGREGRQGHRRPHQLVGARDVQPAAGVGAAHERRGDQERHRLRQADEAAGADSHQHLLRRRQPLGRGLGGRGAGRLLPAPPRPAGHPIFRRARDGRQRRRRGAHPRAGRRRAGAGQAAPGGARPAARGEARLRRRGVAEAGRRARPQGVDPLRDDPPGGRARRQLGLAQHLHVHEEHGRPAGRARNRHRARHRPPGDRRERGRVPVPRVERRVHDLGAAGVPGAEGAEHAARRAQADPGRRPGRPRRRRHADGRRAGDRRAAEAGVPALERRPEPDADGSRDDADRPLQAAAVPRQGDRQQVPERAGGPDGVPPGHRGALRSVLAAHLQPGGQADLEDAGAHSAQLGRRPLLRVRRPHEEGLRRDRARHDRGRREHHALPPLHLRERLRLQGGQHPRAARPADARGPAEAELGAREAGPLRLLDEHPLPGPGALGAARAGRDLRGAPQAGLQLPRPAGALRRDDQAARDADGAAHRARQARGDLQLRRPARAGVAHRGLPAGAERGRRRAGHAVREERARVVDGVLRRPQGARHRRSRRQRARRSPSW